MMGPKSCSSLAISVAMLVCVCCWPAHAHGYKNGTVEVKHPWVLATTQTASTVHMKLTNVTGKPERLVSASAAVATRVSIQSGTSATGPAAAADGQAPVAIAVTLPPKQSVTPEAAGFILRLEGLTRPLIAYDRFAMTLVFEKSGPLDIEVMVEEAPEQ